MKHSSDENDELGRPPSRLDLQIEYQIMLAEYSALRTELTDGKIRNGTSSLSSRPAQPSVTVKRATTESSVSPAYCSAT